MQHFQSIDEAQAFVLRSLLSTGLPASPRGLSTLELFPFGFTLQNPRRRCLTIEARRWSLPAAIGELAWHLSGSTELDFIARYLKRWRSINRNLPVIEGSCYGYRIFGSSGGSNQSQWRRLVELIRADASTRRGVLNLFDPEVGLDPRAADSPCACSLQFIVRGDQLHQIAYMRSNDAIWGLPYDVFIFTMLQELLACELGLELGTYSHMVGSLHLYEQHLTLAGRIVAEYDQGLVGDLEMPIMKGHHQVSLFVQEERSIRVEGVRQLRGSLEPYWEHLLGILESFLLDKTVPMRLLTRAE